MKEQLTSIAIQIIVGVVAVVFVPLLAVLGKKLHDLIDARVKNEKLHGILGRLSDLALTVVQEVEQTVVSKLDPDKPLGDNAKIAKDAALTSLKTHLGEKGTKEIKTVLGLNDKSFDDVLTSFIESKVHTLGYKREAMLLTAEMANNINNNAATIAPATPTTPETLPVQ